VRQNSANRFAYFEKDLFDVLKPLGYRVGLAGKNHSYLTAAKTDFWRPYMHGGGWKADNAPKEVAEFDGWLQRLNHGVGKEPTPFPVETQLPYRIVSDAIDFTREASGRPFALWVSFPEPHNPYQVPKPYFDMFPPESVPARAAGPEVLARKGFKWELLGRLEEQTYPGYDRHWRRTKSNYLGMVRLIDDQVGRLVRHLEESGLMKNTIFVFLADHGDYLTDYGLMRKGVETPECLVRIPMVWCGPGIRSGQLHHPAHVSIADVMPTLCEAAGTPMPMGVQGRSLWPLLQGGEYPADEFRSVYAEVGFGGLHYDATDRIDLSTAII
jgi:arylsulfatase A-like enzyme